MIENRAIAFLLFLAASLNIHLLVANGDDPPVPPNDQQILWRSGNYEYVFELVATDVPRVVPKLTLDVPLYPWSEYDEYNVDKDRSKLKNPIIGSSLTVVDGNQLTRRLTNQ